MIDSRVVCLALVRKERLELSRVTPLAPKASASTNSATFARLPTADYTSTLFTRVTPDDGFYSPTNPRAGGALYCRLSQSRRRCHDADQRRHISPRRQRVVLQYTMRKSTPKPSPSTPPRLALLAAICLFASTTAALAAQATAGATSAPQAREQREEAYEAARTEARRWLDGLEVDAVALNNRGMKGQKKLAEIMDIYLFLEMTSEPQARARINRRVAELTRQTEDDAYHNMQVCPDQEFKQNSMSYLRVMWLMREFELDTTRYERELAAVKPRMDGHLSARGVWQRAMFAQYYERFGMRKPSVIRDGNLRAGVVRRKTPIDDYDRKSSYQLTHEVFVAFDYGYARETTAFSDKDLQYLETTLPALLAGTLARRDTDLASELMSAMVMLGWRTHTTVTRALDHLLTSQNANGSWGHYEAARSRYGDYVEQNFYLHTTGAALRALVGYFEAGGRPVVSDPAPGE